MKTLGILFSLFGILTLAVKVLNLHFILFSWLDHWGNTTGWLIRFSILFLGIFWFLSKPKSIEKEFPEIAEIRDLESQKQIDSSSLEEEIHKQA